MSTLANIRKFDGSSLFVDDGASGYIEEQRIKSIGPFSAPSTLIDNNTAGDDQENTLVGLFNPGDTTIELFLDMDSSFGQRIFALYKSREQVNWYLEMPSGTKKYLPFVGWVKDYSTDGQKDNKYMLTVVVRVNNRAEWTATDPSA